MESRAAEVGDYAIVDGYMYTIVEFIPNLSSLGIIGPGYTITPGRSLVYWKNGQWQVYLYDKPHSVHLRFRNGTTGAS